MKPLPFSCRSRVNPLSFGFTLIEIVLAMGIVAVSVLSITGMLSTAAKAGRDAGNDTLAVSIAQRVLNDMRVTHFDRLWTWSIYDPDQGLPPAPKTTLAEAPIASVGYYLPEGDMMSPDPRFKEERGWQCVIQKKPEPGSQAVPNASPFNRVIVELVITRIEGGEPVPKPTLTLNASIARF